MPLNLGADDEPVGSLHIAAGTVLDRIVDQPDCEVTLSELLLVRSGARHRRRGELAKNDFPEPSEQSPPTVPAGASAS